MPTIGFLGANTAMTDSHRPTALCSDCASLDGPRATMSRSRFAGERAAPRASPRSRPSSSGEGGRHCYVWNAPIARSKARNICDPDRVCGDLAPLAAVWSRALHDRAERYRPVDAADRPCREAIELLRELAADVRTLAIMGESASPRRAGDRRSSGSGSHVGLEVSFDRTPAGRGYRASFRRTQ